ncbi:MAG: hypothetical protein M1829_003142 [Trizodia sp. TS-e1964]|nr:MAG: hypothetical protein M1829_003142 [Trizodia sp. TS-e1964]
MRLLVFLTSIALFSARSLAVHPVKVSGSYFVDTTTNARLQIVGIDYQPGGQSGYKPESQIDPLSNGSICLRDAALMQRLGVNTIRVYNLSPTINHDLCASIFNAVGIYMIIDVNSPFSGESINRKNPESSYNAGYLMRVFGIVEAFKGYPNTLGFFGGNEVINDESSGMVVPPYLRAITRDLKNYIAKHASRPIPVGYSAADVRPILSSTWEYLQCAIDGKSDDMSRSDFFGLNSYSWCGDSTYQTAGYDVLVAQFSNTTVPVFFSEYGCNKPAPRMFNEVQALYGPLMTPVMSGGLVYEFSQEDSKYGLVTINGDGSVQLLTDYDNLQGQYNKLNLTLLQSSNGKTSAPTPPACSSSLITASSFYNKFDLPSLPDGGQDLIDNGIKNPNQGKIVPVTETSVGQKIIGSNGNPITGLAIKPLPNDASNTPTGDNTSAAASPSPSKKASGVRVQFNCYAYFSGLASALLLISW